MSTFRVALLQMTSFGLDRDANLAKGDAFCRRAKESGADVALFPEMWSVGYAGVPDDDAERRAWMDRAVGVEDPFVKHFRALAGELDMAIALSYLERWEGGPRNSVSLIDRHGAVLFTYAKVHTCVFDAEAVLTPGDAFHVATLDTAAGAVEVGAMICYDREFPESARILMLQGAEIILVPNACEMEMNRLTQLRTRAYENMVGIALANYAAPQNNGHSAAFDGVAFDEQEHSLDTSVLEAGPAEDVFVARFDLDRLRTYRERETWGNAFRRPNRYGLITATDVRPPFVRPEARRH
jgi:predicted amidohydrolase